MSAALAPPVTVADRLVRTEDVISRLALRELFSIEADEDDPGPVEGVCAGQWRREDADTWRFWKHAPDSPARRLGH